MKLVSKYNYIELINNNTIRDSSNTPYLFLLYKK